MTPTDEPVVMNAIMLEDAKAGQYVQLVYRPETGATVHLAPQPSAGALPVAPAPAAVCAANGCRNTATGMRKSYVPGWPDEPDCGQHGTAKADE